MISDRIRLLLLEDNPDHRDLFTTHLGMTAFANAEVTVSSSMREGCSLLESGAFDILFLDLALDDSDVTDTLERIASLTPHAPVVVLTSLDDRETLMSIIEKGAQDCLPKSELTALMLERTIRFNIDRWRLRRELLRSEAKFRSQVENGADAFFQIDPDACVGDVNRRACDSLGYARDELIGMHVTDFETALSREELVDIMESMKPGKIATVEGRHQRKDGSTFPVEVNAVLVEEQDGRHYTLCSVRDVSERVLADEKIRRYSQAMEQSGEAIIITDVGGTIEHVNPAFTRITGYTAAEAIGQNPRIMKSGNQDRPFYERLWQTITSGKTWQGKVVNRKKDGTFYPAILTISPVRNEAGEIVSFLGLQQNMERFEALEAQFRQAQKMEAIGTLVGGIAHDFNNTLAGITGNLYLAKNKAPDRPELIARLEKVEQLSYRTAATIQQLLAFSRKGMVEMKNFAITPFFKEVIKLQRVTIPENVDFTFRDEGGDMYVNGDINQLQQVILNVVNNAHDAVLDIDAPAISVTLSRYGADAAFVERNPDLQAGDYALIRVSDNGCGIAPEHQEHIFEPFYTTKEVGKGTGLGLAMVYGTVRTHGGTVEVSSESGRGSEFRIYLPLVSMDERGWLADAGEETIKGHGETILVADDDENVLEVSRELLKGLNYNVITARDGQEAIDRYREHAGEIALVLLDVVMPGTGGTEAMHRIREIDPGARVLFATGYDKQSREHARELVSDDRVLKKPFSITQLSRAVRDSLEE